MKRIGSYRTLTDIPNMNSLYNRMNEIIGESSESHSKFAVFCADIDDFSLIHDTLGNEIGDKVLVEIANRLKKTLRYYDFLARQENDEFIMLITHLETYDYLDQLVTRIQDSFRSPISIDGKSIAITISVGISLYPEHSEKAKELTQFANIAMYFSKSTGKQACTTFNHNMNDDIDIKQKLVKELKTAIDEKQFRIYYQPHIDSRNNHIIGAEALLRWQHPNHVVVLPRDYLIIAEETGLIVEIEKWIISEVFQQMHVWETQIDSRIPISVNLSIQHLQRLDFITQLESIMDIYSIFPSLVTFEISENTLVSLDNQVKISLDHLTELGFGLCIDNFNVEYSSLQYIRSHPVNQIKIDRNFINGIYNDKKDEAVIKSVVSLSQELEIDVIAKGVEHDNQISFLSAINCHMIQGYYYSKPLDAADFENYVKYHSK